MKSALRIGIGLFFITTGILHFVQPLSFTTIVPPWLPKPEILVLISGFCEVAGGAGLLFPRLQKPAAIGLLLLLVAVFPANIYMLTSHPYLMGHRLPDWLLWLRLPLQPLLMLLIWWCALSKKRF